VEIAAVAELFSLLEALEGNRSCGFRGFAVWCNRVRWRTVAQRIQDQMQAVA
jgi:hypothetical protein